MVDMKSLCNLTFLLLTLCFMVVKCSLVPTDQFIDNPTDTKQEALTMHKRPSFFVGSRYGRSGSSAASGSSLFGTSKTRRLNVVPRNDRFFLSSRYGKRAGMDFLQNTINSNSNRNINNNNSNNKKEYLNQYKYDYDYNDNTYTLPLLSTPYEKALISEISTGTQLSSKPIPQQLRQPQETNDEASNSHSLQQLSSSLSSSSLPPYAYMSCVYTGLQNYYRCNSIDSILYFKTIAYNDADKEGLLTDKNGAVLLNSDDIDNNHNTNDNFNNGNDADSEDNKN